MALPPLLKLIKPNTVTEWAKALLTRNLPMKAASLALALVVWAFVQQGQTVERTVFAEVAYSWPEGLVVAKAPPSRVHMTLSGSRTDMRRIDDGAMKVVVDMGQATEGVQSIDYSRGAIEGLPVGVDVLGTRPSSAQLALEPRTGRRVRVEVAQVGEVDEGMRVRFISVEPQEVTVYGPASLVETLESVHTDAVSLSGFDGELIRSVGLNLRGVKNVTVDPLEVEVRIGVESESEQRTVDAVPVIVQGDSWTSVSEHARVAFSGPREAIRGLLVEDLYILLPAPSDLPMAVNSVNLRRGEGADYPFRVLHPPGIDVLSVEPSSFELVRRN